MDNPTLQEDQNLAQILTGILATNGIPERSIIGVEEEDYSTRNLYVISEKWGISTRRREGTCWAALSWKGRFDRNVLVLI
jgi:hypothetical protein